MAAVVAGLNGLSAERRAKLVPVPIARAVSIEEAGPIAEALAGGAHKPLASSVVRLLAVMSAMASGPAMMREQALIRMVMP